MTNTSRESLGPQVKSWAPGSLLRDSWAGKNLPFWFMPVQVAVVLTLLLLCIWGAKLTYEQMLGPMGLSPGSLWGTLAFGVFFTGPMILLHSAGQRLVNRNELAVHEHGVRWAKSYILFDEIDSLSEGTETVYEKHVPTFNAL